MGPRDRYNAAMTANLFDLTGRSILLTGSSGGLGLTMARGLADAGATVVLNGRDEDKLAAAVAQLRDAGHTAHGVAFDVTDANAVAAGVDEARRQAGRIDVLVNNAGINLREPLEGMSEQTWRKVLDVNVTGAFLVARAVVGEMLQRGAGKIINTCSLMSELGRPTIGAYTAAKGALKMLTKQMAVEWGPRGVQANGIGPGYFLTDMTRPLADDPDFDAWLKRRTPAGRWGDPAELIGPAVFLASDASSFVNGQILYVDGGLLASV